MLFNSYPFLLAFLPAALCGYFLLGSRYHLASALSLGLASLFFYGWWDPRYVPLILGSIAVNYVLGTMSARAVARGSQSLAFAATASGVLFNLLLLGYYKYANFLIDNTDLLTGAHWTIARIVLPLGISFFTFTQIAFLIDTYKGLAHEYNFVHYLLFVTYFPHLIAGPIMHHKEMMPQFAVPSNYRPRAENFAVGISIFFVGLWKKAVIADNIAIYVAPVFDAAANRESLTFLDAWGGALCYAMQLYFDFSGYCDMAIGVSRMFGIRLPANFNSPYRATSIIEFWRRWHITLSRFLRDYLYIPLGGSRHGTLRRYANLLVTMLLGGLWHGAGWTFVLWGGLHGCYLAINHAWRSIRARWADGAESPSPLGLGFGMVATFICVVVAWVVFRAISLESAVYQLRVMSGVEGVILPQQLAALLPSNLVAVLPRAGITFGYAGRFFVWPEQAVWIFLTLAVCWFLPNTQEVFAKFHPVLEATKIPPQRFPLVWSPNATWSLFIGGLAIVSLLNMYRVSRFLYYQF